MRSLLAVAFVALPILVLSGVAQAQLKSVAAGVSMPTPMGNASQNLSRPVGFLLEATSDGPFPGFADLHFAASWQPYSVNNMTDSKLHVFNGFVGLIVGGNATGGKQQSGYHLLPFFALDVGMGFDTLSVNGGSNAVTNSGAAFAFQVSPGLIIPIVGGLSAQIATPVIVNFFKDNTLAVWNGSFSVRWAL